MQFIYKFFNVGFLNQDATAYFEKLCESVIEARKEDPSGAKDFLQTLADNMVDSTKGDSDLMVDEQGKSWTREGIVLSIRYQNTWAMYAACILSVLLHCTKSNSFLWLTSCSSCLCLNCFKCLY